MLQCRRMNTAHLVILATFCANPGFENLIFCGTVVTTAWIHCNGGLLMSNPVAWYQTRSGKYKHLCSKLELVLWVPTPSKNCVFCVWTTLWIKAGTLAGGNLLWMELRISKHIYNVPVSGFRSKATALLFPVSKKKYIYGSLDISVEAKMATHRDVYVGNNRSQHYLTVVDT